MGMNVVATDLPYCVQCVFDAAILRKLDPRYVCPSCQAADKASRPPDYSLGLVAARLRTLLPQRGRGLVRARDTQAIAEIADLELAIRDAFRTGHLEAIEVSVLVHRLIRGESRYRTARAIGCSEDTVKRRLKTGLETLADWLKKNA